MLGLGGAPGATPPRASLGDQLEGALGAGLGETLIDFYFGDDVPHSVRLSRQ